jgi:signal transduction histidine kinase
MHRVPTRLRLALVLLLLAALGVALAVWALIEARLQRAETARALAAQARALAHTLGPSLAAAAAAARELDELMTWRLLDDAHLMARLYDAGELSAGELAAIVDQNDLDSATIIDRSGRVILWEGDEISADILEQVGDASSGQADDVILGWTTERDIEHLAVASALPGGGAVVLRIHATASRTFSRQLGVENLLLGLLGSQEVLYLHFREEPGGGNVEVAWDGKPVPPPAPSDPEIREVRGREVFEVEVPVASPAGLTAYLRVGLDGTPLTRAAVSATRRTVLIGIVLVALSLSLATVGLVSRWRALEREEAARRLAEAEAARRRSERLAAAGALTAGVAHEVRSPLNAIVLAAQRIERKHPRESDCAGFAGTIRAEVRRLDTVLRQFLELARPASDLRELTDLGRLVDEVRGLLSAEAEDMGVTLEPVQGAGAAPVDRESIRRAVINLVHNAMEASPDGGTIELLLREQDGGVGIHVLDRGPGIDEDKGDRLFDAFVTTRVAGTGLGLALVRRVADEHGGRCRLVNRSGGGAEATLWLPSAGKGASPA